MGVMSIRQCYNDERLSVNWSDHRIIIAVACIIFNPTFWNIVARKGISSLFFLWSWTPWTSTIAFTEGDLGKAQMPGAS